MKPLPNMNPMMHPELGIESMTSYLRRLGSIYSVSLHQILRYLAESKEVSDLVATPAFRMSVRAPTTLNGYGSTARHLAQRVAAATGNNRIAATTLQRISPSLTPRSTDSIATKRRYCQKCVMQMEKSSDQPIWEPLVWSVATIARCPSHGTPLRYAVNQWKDLEREERWIAPRPQIKGLAWQDEWHIIETVKLVRFCSSHPEQLTTDHAPTKFISGIMNQRGMTSSELAARTGFSKANLDRKILNAQQTTLGALFIIAERFAVSPVDILEDPYGAVRQASLFDPLDGDHVGVYRSVRGRKIRGRNVFDNIQAHLRKILASRDPVPSFASVCRSWGVSTGFVRYGLPEETCRYTARRSIEQARRRLDRRERAYRLARDALTDGQGDAAPSMGLKRVVRQLRESSGMPKHLLARALRDAYCDLRKSS